MLRPCPVLAIATSSVHAASISVHLTSGVRRISPDVIYSHATARVALAFVGSFVALKARSRRERGTSKRVVGRCGRASAFFDTRGRLQRGTSQAEDAARLYVPVHSGNSCVQSAASGGLEPVLLSQAQAGPYLADPDCVEAWLGCSDEGPLALCAAAAASDSSVLHSFWLLDVSHLPEPPTFFAAARWEPLRARAGPSICDVGGDDALAADDYAALLGSARGLGLWHRSVKFCSACGGRTASFKIGRNRRCESCGERFRPRVDPSVIALVVSGSRCLLGRSARWPAGRYSTLAGFVEFGETIEECVVREIQEESGVTVDRDSLRFVASQPWLFPRSLMVGFIVNAGDDTTIEFDENELQDAQWFEAEEVRASLAKCADSGRVDDGSFNVPSRASLARTVIEAWLSELGGS